MPRTLHRHAACPVAPVSPWRRAAGGDDARMRPFRRLALDRRTFLRGGAAAIAVPWLDAMVPALGRAPAAPRRAVFVFAPNGVEQAAWRCSGAGRDVRFGDTLAPLAALRERCTVFRGLAIDGGRGHGDGAGDHARATASFLTCAHPRKTGGSDLQVGVSIDQLIRQQVGDATTFGSLELGMERGAAAGVCDSGYSCAYSNNVSWQRADTPVPKETEPRAVFARLFGDPEQAGDAATARDERRRARSVLDAVRGEAKALTGKLGAADRQKVEQYLAAIRDLEQRLQRADAEAATTTVAPAGLLAPDQGYEAKCALMYQLIGLAFAGDRTRTVSFMLGNGGSNRSYKFLGVPDGHHELSHHGKKPEKLAAIAKIDRFHIEQFAAFLAGLRDQAEGDGDLLAASLVVYGSGIGDGDRHNHDDLPVLLAGEGGGIAAGRGLVDLGGETPMANLYLAILRGFAPDANSFADSKEPLPLR